MKQTLPQRLASALLIELASGNYQEGMRFLSRRIIMRTWGVSHLTATRALEILEQWQLLHRTSRSGHYLQKDFRQKAMLQLDSSQGIALSSRQDWVGKTRGLIHGKTPLRHVTVVIQFKPLPDCDRVDDPNAKPMERLVQHLVGLSVQAVFRLAMKQRTTVSFHIDDTSPNSQKRILRSIRDSGAQGVIILKYMQASDVSTLARPLLRQGLPVVVAFNDCSNTNMTAVNFNNISMGHTALRKLIEAGHRRIAVAVPPRQETPFYFNDRLVGSQLAVKDAPFPVFLQPIVPDEFDIEGNKRFAPLFDKNNPERLTAVFATSVHLLGKLRLAFRQARLRLPQDISLIACSSTERYRFIDIPLDILRMDFEKIGAEAYTALRALYEGNATRRIHLIDCHYEAHGSILPHTPTNPPAKRNRHSRRSKA